MTSPVERIMFNREAPCLISNISTHEKWCIGFVNLETWRTTPNCKTLDFKIKDSEFEEKYKHLNKSLQEYYKVPENAGMQQLTKESVIGKKIELGVLQAKDGTFKRVRFLHLDDNEIWEDMGLVDSVFDKQLESGELQLRCQDNYGLELTENGAGSSSNNLSFDRVQVINYKLRLILGDTNIGIVFNPLEMKLFYLFEPFSRLPFRVRECFLEGTDQFECLNEFRDVGCKILAEDIFDCTVTDVNVNGIPAVTLRSSKYEMTVNRLIIINAVKTFPTPSVPPLGKVFTGATISHMEFNGEVFLQFKSTYFFQRFSYVQNTALTEEKMNAAKAKGPFVLDFETLYVAPYDNSLYRCKILRLPTPPEQLHALVQFVDYGNWDKVNPTDLVPCVEVDELFEAFSNQAVRAHLINTGNIDTNKVYETLPEDAVYAVQTLFEGTTGEFLPCVELVSAKSDAVEKRFQYCNDWLLCPVS